MTKDSIRSLLALNYVLEYCAEEEHMAAPFRVINIAGLAVNPYLTLPDLWTFTYHFMDKWDYLVSRVQRHQPLIEDLFLTLG